jgi:hypothetical protein
MGLLSFQCELSFRRGISFSPLGETGEGFDGSNEKRSQDVMSARPFLV